MKACKGHTLLNMLISLALGSILSICAVHYIFVIIAAYHKVQEKFRAQNARLIARYYINADLCGLANGASSCQVHASECAIALHPDILKLVLQKNIKSYSHILQLNTVQGDIYYYLRKSALNSKTYALYRDDVQHNSVALVEEINDFSVQITLLNSHTKQVKAQVTFMNHDITEVACTFHHAAMP